MYPSPTCCPTCGAILDADGACAVCRCTRAVAIPAARDRKLAVCRSCGALIDRGALSCAYCDADYPTFPGGIAPIARFALTLAGAAVVLAAVSYWIGPIVP